MAGSAVNASGNTPLHWAVQNQHAEVVRVLLERLGDGVDVLARNAFGKSVLTEGFGGRDQGILTMLLEHSSAEEERLLMGKKEGAEEEGEGEGQQQQEADGEQEGGGEEEEQDAIVHRLVLDPEGAPDRVLSVRELVRGFVVFLWFVPV